MDVTAPKSGPGSVTGDKPPGGERWSGSGIILLLILILLLAGGLVVFVNHKSRQQAADLKAAEQRLQAEVHKTDQGTASGDLEIDHLIAETARIKGVLDVGGNVVIDGTLMVNGQPVPGPALSAAASTAGGSSTINHFTTTSVINGGGEVDTSGFALLAGNQTFTGTNTLSNAGNVFGGDGSGLVNIAASNINTGTLSNARLNADIAMLDRDSQVFAGNAQVFRNSADSTTAFRIQNAAGTGNLLVADTANTRLGIGTASPNTTLSLYNGNESITQTDFTQALTRGGLNIVTDFTEGAYTPGIFWSTQDNNPSKPKAGIYMFEDTASGTSLLFGTSGAYATGITNTALKLGPTGDALFRNGTNSPTAFQVQNTAGNSFLTVNTNTGAVLTSSLFIDNLGTPGSTALCLNGSSQISTCSGGGATDLQTAYNSGNSITTTSARDLSFNLADSATDSNFIINMLGGTTSKFQVQAGGIPTFSIGPTGAVAFQNSVNSTNAFEVQNSTGGAPLFKIDSVNSAIGIDVNPTSTGGALQVGGAVSISQFNPTTFTTPNGAGVNTQINIPVSNQGSFSQLLAFGIDSGSADTARVLSVFDARTGAHQPSLGVFSPGEGDILGFSWEGRNDIGYLKVTSGSLGLRSGTTDLLTLSSSGQLGLTSNSRGINVAIGSGATSVSVTFPNAYAGADYAVQCTPSYNTTCYVTGKTTAGFTINFGTAAPNGSQTVDWFVVR